MTVEPGHVRVEQHQMRGGVDGDNGREVRQRQLAVRHVIHVPVRGHALRDAAYLFGVGRAVVDAQRTWIVHRDVVFGIPENRRSWRVRTCRDEACDRRVGNLRQPRFAPCRRACCRPGPYRSRGTIRVAVRARPVWIQQQRIGEAGGALPGPHLTRTTEGPPTPDT